MELDLNKIEKQHAKRIAIYLIEECKTNKELEQKILNSDKTIQGCVKYTFEKAKELAEDNCAWVDDNTVYGWSKDYYMDDSIKEEQEKVKEAQVENLDKEIKDYKEKVEPVKEEPKKVVKKESKPVKPVKEKLNQQLSLFDLDIL